jgi:hypothetical protein
MALTPTNAPDSLIKELFGDNEGVAKAAAAAMERLLNVMPGAPQAPVAELLFSVPHKRRNMGYERVPVGHQDGYRCFDADKHSNAQEAFESGEYGDGMSENEAYVAWLRNEIDSEPAPRTFGRIVNGGGGTQPDETEEIPYRDPDEDVDFDADLEDRDER